VDVRRVKVDVGRVKVDVGTVKVDALYKPHRSQKEAKVRVLRKIAILEKQRIEHEKQRIEHEKHFSDVVKQLTRGIRRNEGDVHDAANHTENGLEQQQNNGWCPAE